MAAAELEVGRLVGVCASMSTMFYERCRSRGEAGYGGGYLYSADGRDGRNERSARAWERVGRIIACARGWGGLELLGIGGGSEVRLE